MKCCPLRFWILLTLDLTMFCIFGLTIAAVALQLVGGMECVILFYVYLQLLVTYMTFRVRFMENRRGTFRIHMFNFLYSIFTLLTGYYEIIKTIRGKGLY